MKSVFYIFSRFIDLLLFPFRTLPPFWGIAWVSLLTAIFILLVYKYVSNQEAISRLKNRIQGHFLGIYLFRHDAGEMLNSLGRLLGAVARYLGHSFLPLVVVIVPVILLCIQLDLRYGRRPFRPGEETRVYLTVASGTDLMGEEIGLTTSPGLSVRTPALRIAELSEADWKVKVLKNGNHRLEFAVGKSVATKGLAASPAVRRLYPRTERYSAAALLSMPGDIYLEGSSPIVSVGIDYPERGIPGLGLELHWAIVYFALALVFGLLLKRPLGVEF